MKLVTIELTEKELYIEYIKFLVKKNLPLENALYHKNKLIISVMMNELNDDESREFNYVFKSSLIYK